MNTALEPAAGPIDVDTLVDLPNNLPIKRVPVVAISMAAGQIAAFFAVSSLLTGEPTWSVAMLCALAGAIILARQAEMLDHQRAALRTFRIGGNYLGALCDATEWPDRRVRGVARLLLTELLSGVTEADVRLFDRRRRHLLYRRLAWRGARWNSELAIAILHALPSIGMLSGPAFCTARPRTPPTPIATIMWWAGFPRIAETRESPSHFGRRPGTGHTRFPLRSQASSSIRRRRTIIC